MVLSSNEKKAFDLHLSSSSRFTGNNNNFKVNIGQSDNIKNIEYELVLKSFSFDNTVNQNDYPAVIFSVAGVSYPLFPMGPATYTATELAQELKDNIRAVTGLVYDVGYDGFLNQFWIQRPSTSVATFGILSTSSTSFISQTGLTNSSLLAGTANLSSRFYFGSFVDLRPIKDIFINLTSPPITNPNFLLLDNGNIGKNIIGRIPLIGQRFSRITYTETSDNKNTHSHISSLGSEIGIRLTDQNNDLLQYTGECFITLHLTPQE